MHEVSVCVSLCVTCEPVLQFLLIPIGHLFMISPLLEPKRNPPPLEKLLEGGGGDWRASSTVKKMKDLGPGISCDHVIK